MLSGPERSGLPVSPMQISGIKPTEQAAAAFAAIRSSDSESGGRRRSAWPSSTIVTPRSARAAGTIEPVWAPYEGDGEQSCAPREMAQGVLLCRIEAQAWMVRKSGMRPNRRVDVWGLICGIIPLFSSRISRRYCSVRSGLKYDFVEMSSNVLGSFGCGGAIFAV